tara:strand:- start:1207 stop:1323 length:117 start_codon:yes stop_codon:yes gene_type:complete
MRKRNETMRRTDQTIIIIIKWHVFKIPKERSKKEVMAI